MIEVPESYVGAVMEKNWATREAELINMGNQRYGEPTHMEFKIPARGLMGNRQEFLTDTNGNGNYESWYSIQYEPFRGGDSAACTRLFGSAMKQVKQPLTDCYNAQDRGASVYRTRC